jgi:hypothetical protein
MNDQVCFSIITQASPIRWTPDGVNWVDIRSISYAAETEIASVTVLKNDLEGHVVAFTRAELTEDGPDFIGHAAIRNRIEAVVG